MAVVINGLTGIESPSVTLDTDTLVIDATNNRVGIGTASPSQALDIDTGYLQFTSGYGIHFGDSQTRIAGYSDTDRLLFFTGNTERVRVTSSGLVGIGTSSPASILHINGAGTNDFPHLRVTADRGLIARLGDTSGSAQSLFDLYDTDGATQIVKFISGGADCFINTGGNVGIGTTSPLAGSKLDVIGRINARDNERISLVPGANPNDPCIIETGGGSPIAFSPEGSEAMRIDTSGNLLLGQSGSTTIDTSTTTTGYSFREDGRLGITRDEGPSLALNRLTTDGKLLEFKKDGSIVGSIASMGGDLFVGRSTGGLRLTGNTKIVPKSPAVAGGTSIDGQMDLGDSNDRFKDLYLSGGVYLGGTGSANKLDDYEEGTWTPEPTSGSWSGYNVTGHYVKVGRMVSIIVVVQNVTIDSSASTSNQIRNLPFTNGSKRSATSQITYYNTFDDVNTVGLIEENQSVITFLEIRASNSWVASNFRNSNNCYIHLTATYYTDY